MRLKRMKFLQRKLVSTHLPLLLVSSLAGLLVSWWIAAVGFILVTLDITSAVYVMIRRIHCLKNLSTAGSNT